jgi:hypothetical protein
MSVPELAHTRDAAGEGEVSPAPMTSRGRLTPSAVLVAILTLLGVILRLVVAHQSLFADELSTYWIVADHGLHGVLSLLYGTSSIHHAEITPPLYFIAAWFSAQFGHSPELLRAPSLVAGSLTIPAVYLLGRRTVGQLAALLASAAVALSPFMIYYSSEARAYGVLMLLVTLSTLSMLLALDTGRWRWWVGYAVCSCAALYTHYTCGFVLAAQLLWLWWAYPRARRQAILANLGVLVGLVPWIPGLNNDLHSPTASILSALSPFNLHAVWIILGHWALGYPYTALAKLTQLPGLPGVAFPSLVQLPGVAALALLAVAAALACISLVTRIARTPTRSVTPDNRLLLMLMVLVATPVGEALVSAVGTHLFGVRNLAASWPALALCFAALLAGASGWLRFAAVGAALVSLAWAALGMVDGRWGRPDYAGAAAFVERNAAPRDVVLDETGYLSPGPLTGLDVALTRRLRIVRGLAPEERDHPFGFGDPYVPLSQAASFAVTSAGGSAIFVVGGAAGSSSLLPGADTQAPYGGYRRVAVRTFTDVTVAEYARRGARG